MTQHSNQSSSEELFIAAFFKRNKIKFESEVQLDPLRDDDKMYRIADFYLPNLNIYVEYFGLYNSTKETRMEYDKKAAVYIKNSVPTIFLYPHELGILEYAFHIKAVRLLKLKKFNLKKQLLRYRWNRYKENVAYGSLKTFIVSFYLIGLLDNVPSGLTPIMTFFIQIICLIISIVSLVEIIKDVRNYFYKDK